MEFTFVQKAKLYCQAGGVRQLGELIGEAGYRKPLIVIDPFVRQSGLVDLESLGLKQRGIQWAVYDEIVPNPPSEKIDAGAAYCRAQGCDCVVAIGGGSCIDSAKGINILRFNEGSILDYAEAPEKMKLSPGLISVPTTAGTGSELSDGVIVTDIRNARKVPILAVMGMSEYVLIDPLLTLGVPRSLTLATGLDVFSHAFEGYTSSLSNMVCDAVVEKIMQMVIDSLPVAADRPDCVEARTQMCVASTLAGWMLGNVSTHVGHSIAHVLGARLHLVHGVACARDLPGVMEFVSEACPEKVCRVGRMLGASFSGEEDAKEIGAMTAAAYRRFRDETLGLELSPLPPVDGSEMEALVEEVLREPFLRNVPRPIGRDDVRALIQKALEP